MVNLERFKGKNVLLLIGPAGPFFYRLAKDLKKYADNVYKINFSGADFIFYPFGAYNYRKKPQEFGKFLEKFVKDKKIDVVIVFNDCRLPHRIAKDKLEDKVEFWVIEQGYIRPDLFTFEKGGVNGFSCLPKDPEFYKNVSPKKLKIKNVGNWKIQWYFYGVLYFLGYTTLKPFFPSSDFTYKNIYVMSFFMMKTFLKQVYFKFFGKKSLDSFIKKNKNKYFFVPLQVYNDSQIRFHSGYKSLEEFIDEVLLSFAQNAPEHTHILIKHHPMDLGIKCYKKFIKEKSREYNIEGRVFYTKTGNVKTLIENSIGCVTINSTVGMEALLMKKPVIPLGRAVYKIEGISYTKSLDSFWSDAPGFRVDENLLESFKYYLIKETQVNGSVYKKIHKNNSAGVYYEF